ncbi:hypothetical protein [Burkholderia multivorans]|uniref:hypothetical protein n=1 Tax=Burkholderia multivorans TaxID=87883 RepID=UPI001C234104|nr:hypothetical protein [Burkholderia multivorans]MBU9553870.1 hypothetical protein [Burkholderia multivorans]
MISLIETFLKPTVKTRKGHRVKVFESPYLIMNFSVGDWTAYVPKEERQKNTYEAMLELDLLNMDYSVSQYNSQLGNGFCLLVVTEKDGKYQKGLCFRQSSAVEVGEVIEIITIREPKAKLEKELSVNKNNNTKRIKI